LELLLLLVAVQVEIVTAQVGQAELVEAVEAEPVELVVQASLQLLAVQVAELELVTEMVVLQVQIL
jgi:hypothetical protein